MITTSRTRLNTPKKVEAAPETLCFRADLSAIPGFATSTIVKVFALAGAVAAFYKYAPSPSDDNIISRYISSTATPSEVWEKVNLKHTMLEQHQADGNQVLWSAQKPPVHRFRYPLSVHLSLSSEPVLTHTLWQRNRTGVSP
jgi:hypothetical protein